MADVKISQLPAATTPVDGTEVLPIVQSATTKQVSIANLTAGRAMSASSLTLTTPLALTSGGTGLNTAAQGSVLSATAADTFSATRTPTLGLAGTAAGALGLSGVTSGVVTLATADAAGTWTMKLPTSGGTNGYILTTNGSGVTSWTNPTALGVDLDVGGTAITGGTAGRVLFQGAGDVLQQSANFFWDNTNNQLDLGAGTVSLPSLSAVGDNNTGYYFPAADTLGLVTNGIERMRITSGGLVGIGTSSPSLAAGLGLVLNGGSGQTRLAFKNAYTGDASTDGVQFTLINGSSAFTFQNREADGVFTWETGGNENLRLDAAGNLGLGVTPSAWSGGAFQTAGYYGLSSNGLSQNGYYNAGWKYATTAAATVYQQGSGAHYWFTAGSGSAGGTISFTQAMTLDASGNLLVGSASASGFLDVYRASQGSIATFRAYGPAGQILWANGGASTSYLDSDTLIFRKSANSSNTEAARIDSGGNLLVGTTNTDPAFGNVKGTAINADGWIAVSRDSGVPMFVNRKTNDGTLVEFKQDGTTEGNISVSGTTVSYNGGHLARWSQLLTGQRDASILKGTVMSNLDEMCVWEKNGVPEANEQLNRMKISDVEGDINVAGVFVDWDNDDPNNLYDMNIAMTGDMIIRIAANVIVQKGDLLMSAGDGTAKPQGDDTIRAKTIAKVTSNHVTTAYDDGSYCVPCVLMAC